MTTWVYIHSEPRLWTVGFYGPDGTWTSETDHDSPEDAAARVAWLNGGDRLGVPPDVIAAAARLLDELGALLEEIPSEIADVTDTGVAADRLREAVGLSPMPALSASSADLDAGDHYGQAYYGRPS